VLFRSTIGATPAVRGRPLLGLRRQPGRLALAVFRMPLNAYRHGAGWMLGRTFLEFTHTGRKTGRPHDAVAMVLHYDEATGEAVICAAWGPRTDWYRNLQAGSAVKVQLGRDSFTPVHRFLTDEEAFDVAREFRSRHPYRLRLVSTILGWGDLREDATTRQFVHGHPFVAFRPATEPPAVPHSSLPSADEPVPWTAWTRAWGGAVVLGVVNGAARRGYEGALGGVRAHQLSSLTLLALLSPWVARTERRHPLPSTRDALLVGLSWATATVGFEFGVGHYINRDSWRELLQAYNLTQGRLWVIDVAGIAALPAVARWWRIRRAAASRADRRPG